MALVLVVEDEPIIRLAAADMLEEAGHEVIEAANAEQAIQILESRTDIEVVFSDVNMPGKMDGLKLLEVIRDRWPKIRLILTSGRRLSADALPSGAAFLLKPYESEAVAQAVTDAR